MVERTGVDPERIADVYLGAANQSGEDNRDVARMAALLAGLPHSVPGATVNRLCASGLEAVNCRRPRGQARRGRLLPGRRGRVDEPGALGRRQARARPAPRPADDARHDPGLALDQPAHGRARRLDRVDGRDRRERRRALRDQPRGPGRLRPAQPPARGRRRRGGRFAEEIVPIEAPQGRETVTVDADEGPRPDASLEKLAKLRPAFREGGTVTAGNASTLNDGAACLLIASEAGVEELGAEPLARVVAFGVAGVDPAYMGIGPAVAVPRALAAAGLSLDEIDLIELNEAFASQVLACARELGIDEEKLNVNGGAIALGHPLGCSGARLTTTLVRELRRRGGRYGIATMCVGVGQGLATVFEAV